MKKQIFSTLIMLTSIFNYSFSQNLVPNPSFEDTVYCVYGTNQVNACLNWSNFGNSPDYFNACCSIGPTVPNSFFGFQYAHTGVAMVGLATYAVPSLPGGPNYREIIGAQLTSSMQIGVKYFFSFYANYSYYHPLSAIASNKIGLRFSTIPFDSCCHPPINNFAHLYTDSILSDTVAWIRLSGSFIADSSYSYVIIGNFFDDTHTDTINLSQSSHEGAYYYIDDVCVSTDSIYNETWTYVGELASHSDKTVNLFPNPTNDVLNIQSVKPVQEIEVLNDVGEVIYFRKLRNELSYYVSLLEFPSGIYLVRIQSDNRIVTSLINLIH